MNTIKIDGDFRTVVKGFEDVVKMGKKLEGQKFGININDKMLTAVGKNMKQLFDDLGKRNENLSRKINKLGEEFNKATDPRKAERMLRFLNKWGAEMKGIEQTMRRLNGMGYGTSGGGGGAPAAGGGAPQGQQSLQLGGIFRGGAYGMVLSQILGMARFLVGPAFQAAQGRLGLRGLGMTTGGINQAEWAGSQFGYSPNQTRQQANSMMRATGSAQGLSSVQLLSRGTGFAPEELIGAMGGLRKAGLSNSQSIKLLKDVFTEAVAAGFDRSRAMEALQLLSDTTAQMASTGAVDEYSIANLMRRIMAGNEFFGKNNMGRVQSGMQGLNAIFQSKGAGGAFAFRTLADMFPNMSPEELMYEQRLGLFRGQFGAAKGFGTIGNILNSLSGGKNITAGGGGGQLTESQKKMGALAMNELSGGTMDVSIAKNLIDTFLTQNEETAKEYIGKVLKEQKTLEEKSYEVMESQDMHLANMEASLEYIREGLAQTFIKFTNPAKAFYDWMSGGSSETPFGTTGKRRLLTVADEGVVQQAGSGLGFGGSSNWWGQASSSATDTTDYSQGGQGYEAIIKAEGTGKGGRNPYNTVLGYGKWGSPDKPLTEMTLDEVSNFGMQMRQAQNRKGIPMSKTSSAVGAFQILGTSTMLDAAKALGMDLKTTKFTPEVQRKMAAWVFKNQGSGAWEGFKRHEGQRQILNQKGLPPIKENKIIDTVPTTPTPQSTTPSVAPALQTTPTGGTNTDQLMNKMIIALNDREQKRPVIRGKVSHSSKYWLNKSRMNLA